jgi:hypothetical protein
MAKCQYCKSEMEKSATCSWNKVVDFPDGTRLPALAYLGDRCHDCGIKAGGHHHPGCDMEVCPKCKGQLISCGCLDSEEDEDDL